MFVITSNSGSYSFCLDAKPFDRAQDSPSQKIILKWGIFLLWKTEENQKSNLNFFQGFKKLLTILFLYSAFQTSILRIDLGVDFLLRFWLIFVILKTPPLIPPQGGNVDGYPLKGIIGVFCWIYHAIIIIICVLKTVHCGLARVRDWTACLSSPTQEGASSESPT